MLHRLDLPFGRRPCGGGAESRLSPTTLSLLILGVAAVVPGGSASANTIAVDASSVAIAADGQCSLREAIVNANDGAATHGDCAAGEAGADTLVLAASSTYTLTAIDNYQWGPNGLPPISSEITIEGNGATIERSGAAAFRLFRVRPGALLTVTDATLRNGRAEGGKGADRSLDGAGGGGAGLGGAIVNEGSVRLVDVTLSANSAAGGAGGAGRLVGVASGGGGGMGGSGFYTAGGGYDGNGNAGSGGPGQGGQRAQPGGFGGGGGGGHTSEEGHDGGFGGGGGGGGAGVFVFPPDPSMEPGVAGLPGFGAGAGTGGFPDDGGYGGGGLGGGGAIFNHGGTVTLETCTLSGNLAEAGSGGGSASSGLGLGGGVFNRNGTLTVRSTTFDANEADAGGGIYNLGDGTVAILSLVDSSLAGTVGGGTDCVDATHEGGTTFTSGVWNSIASNDGCPLSEVLSKSFLPASILPGRTSSLTFFIDNTASDVPALDLAFVDDLPAGVVIASIPNTSTTCADGALSAPAGGATITYSGGSVNAASSCTVTVDVTSLAHGEHLNTSGELTSDLGSGGSAIATLAVGVWVGFAKSFVPTAIPSGGTSTLTFLIDNGANDVAIGGLAFIDTLPAGLTIASTPNASTSCTGGSLVAPSGGSTFTYSSGTVAAASACTVQVDVTSSTPGSHVNTSGDLATEFGSAGSSTAALIVLALPGFSKSFAPEAIFASATSTLTFTIDNGANAMPVGDLAFTDTLPPGLAIAGAPNATTTCTGGTLVAPAGGGTVSYDGGTVVAAASCAVSVDVTGTSGGDYLNTSGPLTSEAGESAPATAGLTVVAPPFFSKSFAPDTINEGETSTLTFTIDSSANTLTVADLAFADTLPAGVLFAGPAGASTTCSGGSLTLTVDAIGGSSTLEYSGGSIDVGSSCVISVDVTSLVAGSYLNVSGDLTSEAGSSGNATSILTVTMPPQFSKRFEPDTFVEGGTGTLVLTIDNSARSEPAGNLAFIDDLPPGVSIAAAPNASTTCTGGTLTAPPGGGTLSYSGGTLAAASTCQVSVDVSSTTVGTHHNVTGALTSDAGDSGTASAPLTITSAAPAIRVHKQAAPASAAEAGGAVTFVLEVENRSAESDPITLTSLVDDPHGDATQVAGAIQSTDCSVPRTLAPSERYACSLTVWVSGDAGDVARDTVTVAGHDDDGSPVSGTASAAVTLTDTAPSISTLVTAEPASVFEPGGDVTFTVTVTAGSGEPVLLTALADDLDGDLDGQGTCSLPQSLPAGGAYACSFTRTIHGSTGESQTTTVTATAEDDEENVVVALGVVRVPLMEPPPPMVVGVTTAAGPLSECATLPYPTHRIGVDLEATSPPIQGAGDVANFKLIGCGPDADFATESCSTAVAGDDVEIELAGVMLQTTTATTARAEIELTEGAALEPGLYRLLVCDRITDAADNPLDGNDDGAAGGDFVLSFFRVDPGNLLLNGHFDDCPVALEPWVEVTEPSGSGNSIQADTIHDTDESRFSGSAWISVVDGAASALGQCTDGLVAGGAYSFRGRALMSALSDGDQATVTLTRRCLFLDQPGCAGSDLGESSASSPLWNGGGRWLELALPLTPPAGVVSTVCSFAVSTTMNEPPPFDVYLDDFFLGMDGLLFSDGFELGTTDAWSDRTP